MGPKVLGSVLSRRCHEQAVDQRADEHATSKFRRAAVARLARFRDGSGGAAQNPSERAISFWASGGDTRDYTERTLGLPQGLSEHCNRVAQAESFDAEHTEPGLVDRPDLIFGKRLAEPASSIRRQLPSRTRCISR